MTETILIRSAIDTVQFVIFSAQDQSFSSTQESSWSDIAIHSKDKIVVGLIPAIEVLALVAQMPPMSNRKLRDSLPYAIEDQLASEVDTQHFAIGTMSKNGNVPVNIIAKDILERHLALYSAHGIELNALYSESALLAPTPNKILLWIDGKNAHLRMPNSPCLSFPCQDLISTFERRVNLSEEATNLVLHVYANESDWKNWRKIIEELRSKVADIQLEKMVQEALPWLARQMDTQNSINLLQERYISKAKTRFDLKRWRIPVALAATVLMIQIIVSAINLMQLHLEEKRIDAALNIARQSPPLLPGLAILATFHSNNPSLQIQNISLLDRKLEVKIQAADANLFKALTKAAEVAGHHAEISKINKDDFMNGYVTAKLTLYENKFND